MFFIIPAYVRVQCTQIQFNLKDIVIIVIIIIFIVVIIINISSYYLYYYVFITQPCGT